MTTLEQGKKLVNLARLAISSHISKKKITVPNDFQKEFSSKQGVFVTLEKKGQLRGCIGIVDAVYPLHEAIVNASVSAATSDPRFPHLTKEELDQVVLSVSVLTRPQMVLAKVPEDYLPQIQIGKDGLLIKGTFNSGLLLPVVAVEQKWDAQTFLSQTCVKAGMKPDSWQDFNECRVYKFQTEVFAESTPNGEVVQKM